jgi:hypothetical protein
MKINGQVRNKPQKKISNPIQTSGLRDNLILTLAVLTINSTVPITAKLTQKAPIQSVNCALYLAKRKGKSEKKNQKINSSTGFDKVDDLISLSYV